MKTTDTQPIQPPEDGCPQDEWEIAAGLHTVGGLGPFEIINEDGRLEWDRGQVLNAIDDFERRQLEHLASGDAQLDALLDGVDQSESRPVEAALQDVHSDEEVTQTFEPAEPQPDVDGKFDNGGDL